MTVGPPMRSAIVLASAASVVKPKSVTGMPARLTISRASYSKKRMGADPIRRVRVTAASCYAGAGSIS